jgi:hypothetical protein
MKGGRDNGNKLCFCLGPILTQNCKTILRYKRLIFDENNKKALYCLSGLISSHLFFTLQ